QNSRECIKRGGFIAYDIIYKKTKRGVICFNPTKGSIAQIYIEPEHRRKGYAKQAIIAAKQQIRGETMGMLNVAEDCVSLNALLNTMGFSLLLTQSEMRFVL
ncbi:MAG: GNAT family N-acetyltransferase, partial [Sphaerochaetaceae bacterium]